MTHRLLIPLLAGLALAAVPAPALADRADDLLIDACRDGRVSGRYSQAEYKKALRRIPADSDQYTDCRDVLRRAKLAAASSGGSGGGSGGSGAGTTGTDGSAGATGGTGGGGGTSGGGATGSGEATSPNGRIDPLADASPDEKAAIEAAVQAGSAPFALAGQAVRPGDPGGVDGNGLPPALLTLIIGLGLLAAAGSSWAILARVRDRRAR